MATQTVQSRDQNLVIVSITPTMAKEFRRRDVFPELRCMGNAHRFQTNGTGHYKVSIDRARELLADAEHMRLSYGELPRGAAVAYLGLARHLKNAIGFAARKGAWVDPGIEEAGRRQSESPARFEVGDRALLFCIDEEYGEEVVIVGGYQMRCIADERGPYIADNGRRILYAYGYRVRYLDRTGDRESFAAAHHLTREDCKPSHLKLVTHEGRHV